MDAPDLSTVSPVSPGVGDGPDGAAGPRGRPAVLFLRVAVGGLLVYAAAGKIAGPAAFADTVENYRLLPRAAVNLFALALPWVEAWTGFTLIAGLWPRGAALAALGLSVMFMAALGQALLRGISLSCGCFGAGGGRPANWTDVGIDALMLLACAYLLRRDRFGSTFGALAGSPSDANTPEP